MKRSTALKIIAAACATVALQAQACDRACLQDLSDQLLDSIAARDPSKLPLAADYAATENSTPSAPNMMVAWRTATAVQGRFYVIDTVSQQVLVMATLQEGSYATLLYGRIKAQQGKIAELELFENRSRGQGGFQYSGEVLKGLPAAWTAPVAAERLPTRAALLQHGRSIFNNKLKAMPAAGTCVLMENGTVVAEHADVAQAVSGGAAPQNVNADGTVPIPCGIPPMRPTDRLARTDIVDEVQGIVVSQSVIHGEAEPYLATNPAESAFVPYQVLAPYSKMLAEQKRSGKFVMPALRPMAATGAVMEVHRVYDGKVQGQHLLVNLGAPGSRSPWTGK